MSLARRHRERMAAQLATSRAVGSDVVSSVAADGAAGAVSVAPAGGNAETTDPVAAQIRMRFTIDMRELKQIQSIEKKIEEKRRRIPEYAAWIEGLIAAAQANGVPPVDEILPTIMVWKFDTADYEGALDLAEHVLRYRIALPRRFERTVGTLVVDQVADAALKALGQGESFDLGILERAADVTVDEDMPDEVRAKLAKAIGLELVRQAEHADAEARAKIAEADAADGRKKHRAGEVAKRRSAEAAEIRNHARAKLGRARELHEKAGVTKQIEKLDRQLKVAEQSASAPHSANPHSANPHSG